MLVLVVRFDLPTPDALTAFDALVRAAVPDIVRSEPDTLAYTPLTLADEPSARVFYEVYSDSAALAAHEARPATARFLASIRELEPTIRVERAAPLLG